MLLAEQESLAREVFEDLPENEDYSEGYAIKGEGRQVGFVTGTPQCRFLPRYFAPLTRDMSSILIITVGTIGGLVEVRTTSGKPYAFESHWDLETTLRMKELGVVKEITAKEAEFLRLRNARIHALGGPVKKQCITTVTVTGADDGNKVSHLEPLAKEFPCIEFGILLARNAMGRTRFPSKRWLAELVETYLDSGIQFAGHLCGEWVTEFLKGQSPFEELGQIHPHLPDLFARFQINTHGHAHAWDPRKLAPIMDELQKRQQEIIFQYDNMNQGPLLWAAGEGYNVSALFDLSHGAGILPEAWPKPIPGIRCGYAGGMSAANVGEQMKLIEQVIDNEIIWIDAETKLRTSAFEHEDPRRRSKGDLFDLAEVRGFAAEADPWVIKK